MSALPNDSRYVSPASTRAASPTGSRGGSFTTKGVPAKSSQSDQSAQSTGAPADTADSSTGDAMLPPSDACGHTHPQVELCIACKFGHALLLLDICGCLYDIDAMKLRTSRCRYV